MGLSFDKENDLMVLVAQELTSEEEDADEAGTARIWATRSQRLVMSARADEVASRGRPICGNCLQPMDLDGHFCPKRNGHR